MQQQAENQPYDEINVTPMLDLAYVLLVIFIIMTTASVQGVKVDLPKTKTSASLAKPGTRAVTVSERGDLFLDAYPMTMESLESRLEQLKAVRVARHELVEFALKIKGGLGAKPRDEGVIVWALHGGRTWI